MKNSINRILRQFGVEIHGLGFIEKQSRTSFRNDAFEIQKRFFEKKNGVTIIDAGANVGNVTQKYLDIFKKASIHAFEPIPEAIELFKNKHAGNESIKLNEAALSNQKGTAQFNINKSIDTSSLLDSKEIGASSDKSCETVEQIDVQLMTLDDYCSKNALPQIDILKMDTQGSELNILKGAAKLLEGRNIAMIFTEIYFKEQYEGQPSFYDIAQYLKGYGYHLKDLYDLYYNEEQILWGDAIFVRKKGES